MRGVGRTLLVLAFFCLGCSSAEKSELLESPKDLPFSVSWEKLPGTIYALDFATPDIGWAVGARGLVLSTNNGGTSWAPQDSGTYQDLYAVCSAGRESVWAVGARGTILVSHRGGQTWTSQESRTQANLKSAFF